MMKLESKELYEIIRHFDDYIEVPQSLAHNRTSKNNRSNFDHIIQLIKKYNENANDKEARLLNLTSLSTHLLRTVEEMLEQDLKKTYHHSLELKKKNYIIDNLKKYIEDKEDLDAEIPSDDDEEEPKQTKRPTKEKPTSAIGGLSKKELDLIKRYQ